MMTMRFETEPSLQLPPPQSCHCKQPAIRHCNSVEFSDFHIFAIHNTRQGMMQRLIEMWNKCPLLSISSRRALLPTGYCCRCNIPSPPTDLKMQWIILSNERQLLYRTYIEGRQWNIPRYVFRIEACAKALLQVTFIFGSDALPHMVRL